MPFHYGWVVAATGTLVVMAGIGLGRFAFGMLLPSMEISLGLSYSQMGFLSTANFVGYLVSVFVSSYLSARFGPRRVILAALLLVSATMVMVGRADTYEQILVLYTLTGVGTAANVPAMGLLATWFSRKLRGRAAGIMVIGSSFAIVLAGKLIPYVNVVKGAEGWRTSWQLLGGLVLVIVLACYWLLVDRPEQIGLRPVGVEDSPPRSFDSAGSLYRERALYHLGAVYFLFGFTYVIYATFIVTALVREWGMSEAVAGNFWIWVGLLSFLSGPVFGTLSDKIGRRAGLLVVFMMQGVAYALVAAGLKGVFVYLSVGFYGVVAWSIPSIMAAAAADYFGAKRAPQAFGLLTCIFGIGQIIGPAIAGTMAEAMGGFRGSFLMAAVLVVFAGLLSLTLKRPQHSA